MLSKDTKLVLYGIIITAYMAMAYDIVKEFMAKPQDLQSIVNTGIAGLISLGVGIGVFVFLIYKKKL